MSENEALEIAERYMEEVKEEQQQSQENQIENAKRILYDACNTV